MTPPLIEEPEPTSLREALLKGLANHTNEFLNPWFFKGDISHEQLTYALDQIMNHSRVFEHLEAIVAQEVQKAQLGENEIELTFYMDVTNSMYVKGFNDAVDQLTSYREKRIQALTRTPPQKGQKNA